jgi:radical SAM superfamily enzyme YgiQ (UPF0313 family)
VKRGDQLRPTCYDTQDPEASLVTPLPPKSFHLILIKPSHYDDDGYVIQWVRSSIPSNSMAAIYGLALDCAERKILGPDVGITITAVDETNTRVKPQALRQLILGDIGLIAFVGVQTNQFPRAMDLARQFRKEGLSVCIGGFHVSGCVAMLSDLPSDLQEAMDEGVSLFAGEVEGHLDRVLLDAYHKQLKPLYNMMKDPPGLEGQPVPYLPAHLIHRMSGSRTSFDAGRGCPFLCSFCTIINVQGRKSRYRTPDDIEHLVRTNVAQGIYKFFITDDNFARNKAWESIFDRLIHLREKEGLQCKITIQVDTLCHKIPRFIEKAGRAGVDRVFIGLESINPDSLASSRKHQNKITEYRGMLQAWHGSGALILAGLILGFPTDTRESILRDIRIIQHELPIDLLYFFILTPLPGSQDHQELYERGVPLEPDMNQYDSVHVTTGHSRMSKQELLDVYHQAWDAYYTPEHVERVMRRSKRWGFSTNKVKWMMLSFYCAAKIENVHPMDSGVFRRKFRGDRRSGRPIENVIMFYGRYITEIMVKHVKFFMTYLVYHQIYRRVMNESVPMVEHDVAMKPVDMSELDHLELYTINQASKLVVEKAKQKAMRKTTEAGLGKMV